MNVLMRHPAFILLLAPALGLAAPVPAAAENASLIGTHGDWEAYTEQEGGKPVCYVGSQPKKAEGKYSRRGESYVLITHRPAEKSADVVSVKAGYAYQKGSEVDLVIGTETFKLFTDSGHAFAYDEKTDSRIVQAMIRGAAMVVKGTSSRGTLTTDTYSLTGFTAAYKAINQACGVK